MYVGQNFTPLPHESSFGVVARFVWMNQMLVSNFRRMIREGKVKYMEDIGCGGNESIEWFLENFKWHLDPVVVEGAGAAYSNLLFISDRLRICAMCVDQLYHSVWHQFAGITECPLHGCSLQESCSNCRTPLGRYILSTAARGFRCGHCHRSLSGGLPSIGGYQKLWGRRERMHWAFSSCVRKLQVVSGALSYFDATGSIFLLGSLNRWWPNKTAGWDLAYDITTAYRRHGSVRPVLTWLVWNDRPGRLLRDSDLNLIYSETLWMLRRWLTQRYPKCQTVGDRPTLFKRGGMVRQGVWPPAVMAYMLMRYHLELASTWGIYPPSGIPRVDLERLVPRHIGNIFNAESVQALVLGRFAAYYWWVISGAAAFGNMGSEPLPACWIVERPWDESFSAIVFPPIENMPLGRFDPSPIRLKDAVEMARCDILFKRRERQASRRSPYPEGG